MLKKTAEDIKNQKTKGTPPPCAPIMAKIPLIKNISDAKRLLARLIKIQLQTSGIIETKLYNSIVYSLQTYAGLCRDDYENQLSEFEERIATLELNAKR